jgi:hypothetical protein
MEYEDKPVYLIPHKWATKWLGEGISVTDIDLAVSGKLGINVCEIKRRSPFLNRVQKELFLGCHLIHIVVANIPKGDKATDEYQFEALTYEVYCPWGDNAFEYAGYRKSWVIVSPPQRYISRDIAKLIFRGDTAWPCCHKVTFANNNGKGLR